MAARRTPSIAAAVTLLLLLRSATLWIGVFIGLKAKSQEAVAAIQVVMWPLLFLSTVFIDPCRAVSASPKRTPVGHRHLRTARQS